MIYMICYDIADPKRLVKISKLLLKYGIRVQKSFFQADIERNRLDELVEQAVKILKKRRDSFFIYPLCASCTGKGIVEGEGKLLSIESYMIL